jgi:putative protease
VTFNIFAHNEQLADIEHDMKAIAEFSPDAFIMADLGVINLAKKVAPSVPIHVSTQANSVNIEDVRFWAQYGAKRVVLARELTLVEIAQIHEAVPEIELEAFVHGSMCISYSGRCLMSNYMTGRDANRGECSQPCRWNYNVYLEEKCRPGELFPAEESENGTNIMSSKDVALVTHLDKVLESGIVGLKVEGRNKSEYYLASIGYTYRKALDAIAAGTFTDKLKGELETELTKINHRGYTTGFIYGEGKKGETYDGRSPIRDWEYVAAITSSPAVIPAKAGIQKNDAERLDSRLRGNDEGGYTHEIIIKNKIKVGDTLEVLTPASLATETVISLTDVDGTPQEEINPGKKDQKAIIELEHSYIPNTFLRKKV